jgi:TRAP-type C4-dicarboxylate transport system permease small subunit
MESGRMMLLHSIVIGLVLYVIMLYGLNQNSRVAENRSLVLAALALIYMIMFGHGLPGKINSNLFIVLFEASLVKCSFNF